MCLISTTKNNNYKHDFYSNNMSQSQCYYNVIMILLVFLNKLIQDIKALFCNITHIQ